jgi:hypothetical protein
MIVILAHPFRYLAVVAMVCAEPAIAVDNIALTQLYFLVLYICTLFMIYLMPMRNSF